MILKPVGLSDSKDSRDLKYSFLLGLTTVNENTPSAYNIDNIIASLILK